MVELCFLPSSFGILAELQLGRNPSSTVDLEKCAKLAACHDLNCGHVETVYSVRVTMNQLRVYTRSCSCEPKISSRRTANHHGECRRMAIKLEELVAQCELSTISGRLIQTSKLQHHHVSPSFLG